jgi:regulatory protein
MEPAFQKALSLALRHLKTQDLTGSQLVAKLSKARVESETSSEVVAWLSEKGFLSERRLTESLLLNSRWTRDKGDIRLREKLLEKGVPESVIDEVLEDVTLAPEPARAMEVLQAKFRGDRSPRRVAGFLERKGFSGETIEQILESDFIDLPEEGFSEGDSFDPDFRGDF